MLQPLCFQGKEKIKSLSLEHPSEEHSTMDLLGLEQTEVKNRAYPKLL